MAVGYEALEEASIADYRVYGIVYFTTLLSKLQKIITESSIQTKQEDAFVVFQRKTRFLLIPAEEERRNEWNKLCSYLRI
jgi:hypothetical protein